MSDDKTPPGSIVDEQLVVIDRRIRFMMEMSPEALEGIRLRAKADADVAKATHATPARQETVRSGLVIVGVLATGISVKWGVPKEIVLAVLTTLAAVFGVPAAIDKWRKREK